MGSFEKWALQYRKRSAQRHWTGVFLHCGTDLVAIQERLQNQRRSAFLQQHYQEIAAAESGMPQKLAALEKRASASQAPVGGQS